MTSAERIARLRTAAGRAGDLEQVELCDEALAGDPQCVVVCLDVCREDEIAKIDVREWVRNASVGVYLGEFWVGEADSRCGWYDSALADIRHRLEKRGLTLTADDRGLVVVGVSS